MKTLKLLGIIALTALIVIGMTGCDPEVEELLGNIERSQPKYGVFYSGETVTARYTGEEEDITWKWYNSATNTTDGFLAAEQPSSTYTVSGSTSSYTLPPTTTQRYVTVWVISNADPEDIVKLADVIILYPRPAYYDFFGIWLMDAVNNTMNSGWKTQFGGTDGTTPCNETVVIREDSFRLDSQVKSAKDGVLTEEYFYFNIGGVSGWTVTSDKAPGSFSGYTGLAYQLSGTQGTTQNPNPNQHGYPNSAPNRTFKVFLGGSSGDNLRKMTVLYYPNATGYILREYIKQD